MYGNHLRTRGPELLEERRMLSISPFAAAAEVDCSSNVAPLAAPADGEISGQGLLDVQDTALLAEVQDGGSASLGNVLGDMNFDGMLDFGDIVPFINLLNAPLTAGGVAMHAGGVIVPEPAAIVLLVLGIVGMVAGIWRTRPGSLFAGASRVPRDICENGSSPDP